MALDWLFGLCLAYGTSEEYIMLWGLFIYSILQVHNALRYGRVGPDTLEGAFDQFMLFSARQEIQYEEQE